MQALTDNATKLQFENERLDKSIELLAGDAPISMFNLKALNDLLGGIYPGLIYILGATPGAGKTTFILQIADDLAASGQPIIFVSCELSEPKLLQKSLARIEGKDLTLSKVVDAASPQHPNHNIFEAAVEKYRASVASNIAITGPISLTELGYLVASCKRERGKAPVVFIDYLQILACGDSTNPFIDERLAISSCIQGLRDIATFYGAPIFTLSTITRSSYGSKSPNLAVFGGSSAVEYSVDVALYLTDDKEEACLRFGNLDGTPRKLIMLKNRYGSLGEAKLSFDALHAIFSDRS